MIKTKSLKALSYARFRPLFLVFAAKVKISYMMKIAREDGQMFCAVTDEFTHKFGLDSPNHFKSLEVYMLSYAIKSTAQQKKSMLQ
jgi:hypothetical protein